MPLTTGGLIALLLQRDHLEVKKKNLSSDDAIHRHLLREEDN